MIARLAGYVAAIAGMPAIPVCGDESGRASLRLVLLILASALLVAGLALAEVDQIRSWGSLL